MAALILHEFIGALCGVCLALLSVLDPDMPQELSPQQMRAIQRQTMRQCAASKRKGERCHPVAEKGKRR